MKCIHDNQKVVGTFAYGCNGFTQNQKLVLISTKNSRYAFTER